MERKTIWQKIREKRFEADGGMDEEVWRAYAIEEERLQREFEKEALAITNLTDHPEAEAALFYATEIGHENGHETVLHLLTAFAELLGTNPKWEPDEPTGVIGNISFNIIAAFGAWVRETRLGYGFDANTEFYVRGEWDVAFVSNERWDAATVKERKIADLSPSFLIKLRSNRDDLEEMQDEVCSAVQSKTGAQLAWLLDLTDRTVYVYRRMGEYPIPPQIEKLIDPAELSGESVAPGFTLKLAEIWGRSPQHS